MLGHLWESEDLFLILTAYFDESGTHGDSPATIMAGLLGNSLQWGRFQTGIDDLRRRYGFRIFHAIKFKKKVGEFEGWPSSTTICNWFGFFLEVRLSASLVR